MSTTYPSKPLGDNEIRILTLQPDDPKEAVVCQLDNMAINDAVKIGFKALSYTWGPPSQPQHVITVDGCSMTAGQQLFDALCAYRSSSEPDDMEEKSKQIPLMGQIYNLAEAVEIWLGPDEDDSQFALDAIAQDDLDAQVSLRFVQAMTKLIQRPWFSRVWIIQELALASREPLVRSGAASTPWDKFSESFFSDSASRRREIALQDASYSLRSAGVALYKVYLSSPLSSLASIRETRGQFGPSRLGDALCMALSSRATDSRDKVYGLLGLVDEETCRGLRPNYEQTIDEVCRNATAYLLQENHSFLCYFNIPLARKAGVPSWVLDFSYTGSFVDQVFPPPAAEDVVASGTSGKYAYICSNTQLHVPSATIIDQISAVLCPRFTRRFWGGGTRDDRAECLEIQVEEAEGLTSVLRSILPLYSAARDSARWWAGERGIDPLWQTLLGPGLERRKCAQLTPEALQENLEILTVKPDAPVEPLDRWRATAPLSSDLADMMEPATGISQAHKPNFFVTENGLCGLVVGEACEGDVVAELFGGSGWEVPFVLRKEEGGMFSVVGIASIPTNWRSFCERAGRQSAPIVII